MFSQCQAIHARALLPCPDAPTAKFTYDARVTVPEWATALMSAVSTGEPSAAGGARTFGFEQHVPIPSYLTAIAVGELADLGLASHLDHRPDEAEVAREQDRDERHEHHREGAQEVAAPLRTRDLAAERFLFLVLGVHRVLHAIEETVELGPRDAAVALRELREQRVLGDHC